MKKRYILSAIVALLPALVSVFAQNAGGEGLDLTIVTSNVRYDEQKDGVNRWDNRKDALAAEILSTDPDIIGTQECLHHQRQYLK